MSVVFEYRTRASGSEWLPVEPYSVLRLSEGQHDLLRFSDQIAAKVKKELSSINCEQLDEALYALRIINFAGEFTLSTVQVQIIPGKFTASSMSQMLEEISDTSATLLFGWGAPTLFKSQASAEENNPPPYHQLQFLRRSMLWKEIGERLQDDLSIIEQNPASEFDRNRKPVSLSHVKHLDNKAMQKLVSHPGKLSRVTANSPLYDSALARALSFGEPPSRHLPVEVWQPTKQLSFDTFENRFVKRVLQESIDLVNRFVTHKKLHQSMRDDCQQMLSILTTLNEAHFLREVIPLQSFTAPSQALLKLEGYRGVFNFWANFIQHRSLPLDDNETRELLEGKNIALLYEYWVFVQVISAVAQALNVENVQKISIVRDELGGRLGHSLSITFNEHVAVKFNQSYTRSSDTCYSTPLRPDVVLAVKDKKYIFDAKYKMTKASIDGDSEDKGLDGVYKRADLYKMHAYRDAIYFAKAAFVVYPGSESVFYSADGKKIENFVDGCFALGVGAIALQPGSEKQVLNRVIANLLIQ